MFLVIGDSNGNTLGMLDITGSKLIVRTDDFANADTLYIPVSAHGALSLITFTDSQHNLLATSGTFVGRALGMIVHPGDTVGIRPGELSIAHGVLARARQS